MNNPKSLIYTLYTYWDIVEYLVRLSRECMFFSREQILKSIARVSVQPDAETQEAILNRLIYAGVLQSLPRSDDFQINPYVLEFARSLTREHELGLAEVLRARVNAIRSATETLNEGLAENNIECICTSANKLAELFRQIYLQLDQDKHALLELVDKAKSADSRIPITQRYKQVLEAYNQYVEPMNQMMDSSMQGVFYRYLEDAEYALDLGLEHLSVQGILYSHRQQLRLAAHQTKELRRFGRLVAQKCADTLLPLREELRQHNALTQVISSLLGQVRKRGLRRTFPNNSRLTETLPIWQSRRRFHIQLGDEVRTIMAAARHFEPQSVAFPQDNHQEMSVYATEYVDETEIIRHLCASLPVDNLLGWLNAHYDHLQDATLLRLFHDFLDRKEWHIAVQCHQETVVLRSIRITHYPHRVSIPI